MDLDLVTAIVFGLMLAAILGGIHIALALGVTSLFGTYLLFDDLGIAAAALSNASATVLSSYVFATIPLFILMGEFIARSGAAADLYGLMNLGLKRVPARLAVATVAGNAVFAAVTGVSVAAAAAFSRIAYPEMRRYGYARTLALGVIAGSSMLGMLIPPSILMIFWGVLTEQSIGKLFMAGVLPGLLLALAMMAYLVILALIDPSRAPFHPPATAIEVGASEPGLGGGARISAVGTIGLVLLVFGGIWLGWFTPTEAAGVGAVAAFLLALVRGMRWRGVREVVLATGRNTVPIMLMLLTGAIYSRFLVSAGAIDTISGMVSGEFGLGLIGTLAAMTLIWLVLGCFVDSTSIILITVPLFAPIANGLGVHPLVFAIYGIMVIEAGLITPPFGLLVFTVKGAVAERDVQLGEVFRGALPYVGLILGVAQLLWLVPGLATWLPG